MANELSFTNLETDAGLAHILSGEVHLDLYDPVDLRGACTRRGFRSNAGSETMKTPRIDFAHVFTSASSEISGGGSNENIGSANFQLTVSRRYMRWQLSQLWEMVAPAGSLDLDLLRRIIVTGTGLTFTDILTALFPSLSNSVGSTTGQMSVDYMYDAQYQLNSSRAAPPYNMVVSPHGFNRWQESLAGYGGPVQFKSAAQTMLDAAPPGLKGEFGGILVWDSDSVTLDGGSTYHRSAMFSAGCFEYTEAPIAIAADPLPPSAVDMLSDGVGGNVVRMVRTYDADNALTLIVGDYYPAAAEAEDARGVLINHLAT